MSEDKCPYCGADYANAHEKLYYYFPNEMNAFNDSDLESLKMFFSMNEVEIRDVFIKHDRGEDSKYLKTWNNCMGGDYLKLTSTGANGIIISTNHFLKCLLKQIEKATGKGGRFFNDSGNLNFGKIEHIFNFLQANLHSVNSKFDVNVIDDPQEVARAKKYNAFPLIGNNAKLRKVILDNYTVYLYDLAVVEITHDAASINPTAVACFKCENFLPIEFFKCKHFVISLIGGSHVGKTTFTMSLLKSSYANLIGDDEKREVSLKISGRLIANIDNRQREFTDQLGKIERHSFPDATNYPMPGVFLQMQLSYPPQKCIDFILCLMDTPGEAWQKKDEIWIEAGETMVADASLGIKDSDAFIFLFDGYVEKNNNANIHEINLPIDASMLFTQIQERLRYSKDNNERPIAFVFNKLDKLIMENKNNKSPQLSHLPLSLLYHSESCKRKQLYSFEDACIHNACAYKLIQEVYGNNSFSDIKNENYNWFAVSAMIDRKYENENDERTKHFWKHYFNNHESINIHEPLLWLLYKLLSR